MSFRIDKISSDLYNHLVNYLIKEMPTLSNNNPTSSSDCTEGLLSINFRYQLFKMTLNSWEISIFIPRKIFLKPKQLRNGRHAKFGNTISLKNIFLKKSKRISLILKNGRFKFLDSKFHIL